MVGSICLGSLFTYETKNRNDVIALRMRRSCQLQPISEMRNWCIREACGLTT
jgi:hypothetical protein